MSRARLNLCLAALLAPACGGGDLPKVDCPELMALPDQVSLPLGGGRGIGFFEPGVGWRSTEDFVLTGSKDAFHFSHGRLVGTQARARTHLVFSNADGCEAELFANVVAASPFVGRVIEFVPGSGAGFGQDRLPDVVMGPPEGGGEYQGSTDVLSLGYGGSVGLGFDEIVIFDGEGADFIVFENPFFAVGGVLFSEPARLELDASGERIQLPCDPSGLAKSGCAGAGPVFASRSNLEIDPTDPERAGGDPFDLEGLTPLADEVWIADVGTGTAAGGTGGFDLDAVSVVHWLYADTSTLTADPASTSLSVGATAPIPRIDAIRDGGEVVYGVPAKLELDGAAVSVDHDLIEAVAPGVSELIFSAGAWTTRVRIEVKDEMQ